MVNTKYLSFLFASGFPAIRSFVLPVGEATRPSTELLLKQQEVDVGLSRRQLGELGFAAAGLGLSFLETRELNPDDYGLWGVLPVGTYKQKQTIRREIVPGKIWTFDQKFGILNVQVPIRMTVVKLSNSAGLFVYNPVAATPQCVKMLKELILEHGPVKHVVVGSVALEHKVYAGVLAQKFPNASVWLTPGQYAYPVNLPDAFLGFPASRTKAIPTPDNAPMEWKLDFDFLTLGPFISKDGAFGETVFRHKETKTLIVTDTALEVSEEVPEICELSPGPLLYHARDTVSQVVQNTPEARKIGWRRVALFGLFFTPSAIDIKDGDVAFRERRPDINSDFLGIYPWDWVRDDKASFDALTGGLLVAPILQVLILNRNPIETLDFADKIAKWDIERIIPAHFKNDLKFSGSDFRRAYTFLDAHGVPGSLPRPLAADLQFLKDSEVGLIESGAIVKVPPLPGGKISREDILKQTVYQCRAGVCAPRSEM